MSKLCHFSAGVPQGLALGPLLFCNYNPVVLINPIPIPWAIVISLCEYFNSKQKGLIGEGEGLKIG